MSRLLDFENISRYRIRVDVQVKFTTRSLHHSVMTFTFQKFKVKYKLFVISDSQFFPFHLVCCVR